MALARTLQGSVNLANTTEGTSHDGTLDCGTVTTDAILIVSACGTPGALSLSPSWTAPTKSSGTATIGTVTQIISDTPGADFDTFSTSWRIPVTGGGTLVLSVGDTGTTYGAGWTCMQYTGQDPTTPVAGAVAAASNATTIANVTLGATPDAADEVVQVCGWDTDAGSGKGQTVGTNFTQRYSLGTASDYLQMHVATRAGSVSTSTTVVFATQDGTPGVYTGTGHAFIVKAAPDTGATGSGTPTLAAATSSGTGTQTHTGSGAPTLDALTAAGTGTQTHAGSGTPTLAAATSDGSGVHGLSPSGSGTPTLDALTAAGTGTQTHTGSGTPTLAAATSSGSGTHGASPSGSGTPTLSAATSTGVGFVSIGNFPVAVASGGRYLEDQNGNPWFGSGDTAWSAVVQLTNAEITTYTEAMAAKNVNLVLVNAIDAAYGTNAPNNIDNVAPFTGTAFQSSLNETYWARFDFFIGECVRQGITVLVCPQYFGFSTDGWKTELAAASNAQCLAYGQAVGQRVRGVRGIMWAAGGDANPDATTIVRQRNIVDGINDHHTGLWCGHTAPTGTDTAAWSSDHYDAETWLDFEFGYHQGTTIVGEGESHFAGMSTVRPMLYVAEGGYFDDDFGSTDRKDQRRDIYGGPLSGGLAGFLYGDAPRWHFNGYTDGTGTWEDSLDRDGTADVERAATDIFANFQADTLRPDTTSTFVTGGKSSGATEAAASFDTVSAIIYTQTTGTITLDLTELSGVTAVRVRRYDPTDGTFTTVTSSEPTSNSAYGIAHPGNNAGGVADWLYVLDAATPTGSGTPTLSSFTAAGTGTFGSDATGTGTPTLAAATSAGTGTQTQTGTGTPTLAAATSAGTGVVTATGTGTPTLDAATSSGVGTQTHTGSGTPTLDAATAAGTGVFGSDPAGTGSPTLDNATSSGSGTHTLQLVGTGTPTLAAVTATGTGTLAATIAGTGTPILDTLTAAGVGVMAPSGSGTPTLAAFTASGAGIFGAVATITGRLRTRRADTARTTRRSDTPRTTRGDGR